MADNINDNDGEKDLVIDRSHIGCDWCGKPGPAKNCSRCMSYYYCNRECQVNDWKNHKEQCAFLKDRCEQYKDDERIGEELLKDKEEYEQKEEEECAICLEVIELPISLECGHVFCVKCLVEYQTTNLGKGSCPNCRGDMSEIGSVASKQMGVYIERAKRSHGAEREVYLNLALQQIEAAMNIQSVFQDQYYKNQLQINTLFAKCGVYSILDMHHEVIEKVDDFMELCAASTHGVDADTSLENIIEARMYKAEAYLGLEEWQTALDWFKSLYEDCKDKHRGIGSNIAAGISRAQYELGNYHEASVEGCRAAYRDNRYRAGVHKYVALSQMKLGDIAGAKKSITRGILHEEQWDEKNRKENEDVLRMILAEEKVKNNKQKGKKKGKKKKGRGKK